MKQERTITSITGSTKTEPVSRAVDPGAVSRMGTIVAPGTKPEQMYEGRGLQAPMAWLSVYRKTADRG